MGSWGYRTFEDDTALDACATFLRRPSQARLSKMFEKVDGPRRTPDDMAAAGALVAAELVAALRGHASKQLPDEARDWVANEAKAPAATLAKAATRAVKAVHERSELARS